MEVKTETDKSNTILSVVVMLATLAFAVVGTFLQQFMPVVQLLVIVLACGIVVCVLIWLPRRTSEYIAKHLQRLDSQMANIVEADQESRKEIYEVQNRVRDLCVELTEGTEQRMSWTYLSACMRTLKDLIQADTSFKPDIVLSVGRSGAVVGSILAGNMGGMTHLGIDRKNNWEIDGGRSSRTVEIYPSPRLLASALTGRNILCVMSECDSGRTLEALMCELERIEGLGKVKTAVLFRNANTYFCPDYIAREDQGERPKFPFKTSDWKDNSKLPHL